LLARRAALDDVGDVDVVAAHPDRLDDLRQQLPRAPDKRLPLDVFVPAGRFADEHQVGIRIADAIHDLRAAERVQLAARAVADVVANGGKRVGLGRKDGNKWGGPCQVRLGAGAPLALATHPGHAEFAVELQMGPQIVH
jgi:hypothetical protein